MNPKTFFYFEFFALSMRSWGGMVINFSIQIPLILEMFETKNGNNIGQVILKKMLKNIKLFMDIPQQHMRTNSNMSSE